MKIVEKRPHPHEASVALHERHRLSRVSDQLREEHRVIEMVLGALEKLASTESTQTARWAQALEFVRDFADRCHHHKEEKLLFPALERHGIPRDEGPLGVMLAEHEEGRERVRAMFEALPAADKNPAAKAALLANARAYLRLLRDHIQKEDEVLFPMADEVLAPEEQESLASAFEEYETREMGPEVHEKYVQIARDLAASK